MTQGPATAREAVENNAKAIMAGHIAVVMGQLTPEAMAQMLQLGGQGGMTPQQLPAISGYEIVEVGRDEELETFHVTFHSEAGSATLSTKWKQVLGQWKIAELGLISAQAAPDSEQE